MKQQGADPAAFLERAFGESEEGAIEIEGVRNVDQTNEEFLKKMRTKIRP